MHTVCFVVSVAIAGVILFSPNGNFFPLFGMGVYLFFICLATIFLNPSCLFFMWSDIQFPHKPWVRIWISLNRKFADISSIRFVYYFWLVYFGLFVVVSFLAAFGVIG